MDFVSLDMIERLLRDKGIDMRSFLNSKKGDLDETLLHYYAGSDNTPNGKEICQLLLKYGADVNCIDKTEKTPLHRAVSACKIDITKLLLNHGAYVNAQDKSKNTPLLNACTQNFDLCELLLTYGADPNIKNNFYETPIFRVVQGVKNAVSPCKKIVKLLLHHGGNVEIRNLNQKNAIEVAYTMGNEDIFDWCKQNVRYSSGKRLILILVHSEIYTRLLKSDSMHFQN